MPSLSLENISKNYGNFFALKDVNLKIDGPGVIGILGPNGAGKTTMLKILTNIVRPGTGSARINGIHVSEFPAKALANVGALVEQPEFYPYLTAREILKFVIRIKQVDDYEAELRRVAQLTSISSYLDRKAGELSKGMKQRLGLAVALVGDPSILILDEPTFGLDPSGMKRVRDLIKDLKKEGDKIIILSTHLIYEAQELCDRIVIVHKGAVGLDTSNGENKRVKIELENPAENISFPPEMTGEYSIDGNNIYVTKNGKTNNYDLISHCINEGHRVKWVVPYNDIENTYISITKEK